MLRSVLPWAAALLAIAGGVARPAVAAPDGSPLRAAGDVPAHAKGQWMSDFAEAEALARKHDLPLLVHFGAAWCGPCRQMERDVLKTHDVVDQFGRRYVAVKIDSDRHPDLVRRFGVEGLPTDLFLAPDGRVLARSTGYVAKGSYVSQMARVEARHGQESRTRIAAGGPSARPEAVPAADPNPKPATDPPADATQGDHEDPAAKPEGPASVPVQPRIGLDGFSPVALFASRSWVKGDPHLAVIHQDVVYFVASDEERRKFDEEPGRFVPRLLGCDPVVLSDTDRAVAGSTKYGAYFDGELFLFVSPESRDRFKKTPYRFTRTRHVLRVDQIEKTTIR
jgi:thiol-disulfide isomerase/thioredoxin/YHS domain-containing protein